MIINKPVKTGMIGYGYWGKLLFRYFSAHRGFDIKAVATRHPEEIRNQFSDTIKTCHPDEIFDMDIESVIIATPLGRHHDYTMRALEKGMSVFCEKPLCGTSDEAETIYKISREKKIPVFTDYILTFSDSIRKMAEMISKGEIGRLHGFHFSIRQLGHFCNDVYADLGCHVLSILDMLAPAGDPVFYRNDILVRDSIVETGQIIFRSTNTEVSGSILLSFNHPEKERNFTAYGDKGTLVFNPAADSPLVLTRYEAARDRSREPLNREAVNFDFDETNTLEKVTEHFYRVLSGIEEDNLDMSVRVTKILHMLSMDPGVSGLRLNMKTGVCK